MSDYEYDTGASRLVLSEGLDLDDTHLVMVSAEHLEGGTITVPVRDEDAPAVALAILEAAGIKSEHPGIYKDRKHPERMAMFWLEVLRDEREEQSVREAEDAKVREFFNALNPGYITGNVGLTDRVREQYRAARKFFEGA